MQKIQSIARIAGGTLKPSTKTEWVINVASNSRALTIVIVKLEKADCYIVAIRSNRVYFTI